MDFLKKLFNFGRKKEVVSPKLPPTQNDDGGQWVFVDCKRCNKRNHNFIPKNVIIGAFGHCEGCDEMIYFPSPQSPFKEGEDTERFVQLVKENIH